MLKISVWLPLGEISIIVAASPRITNDGFER